MTAVLPTPRLDLVLLGRTVLEAVADGRLEAAAKLLGLDAPPGWAASMPARRRVIQLEADPTEAPWLLRAMALRAPTPRIVGHIGFHEPPDADGRVEIGYEVLPHDRRRGYTREAVMALAQWASTQGAQTLVASISPANGPSLALARSLGLQQTGSQWDEEDGLELVFERTLPFDA